MVRRRDISATGDQRAGDATRESLIRTGERLIAEHGLEAVSVRDITSAAGANTAALHYHFGSKEELIRAILADRALEIAAIRAKHLDPLETGAPGVDDVVEAIVEPTFELVSGGGHVPYVGFLAALLDHPTMVKVIEDHLDDQYERYVELLERVRPDLPRHVVTNRVSFAFHLVLNTMAQPPRGLQIWIDDHDDAALETLKDDLIEFLRGGLGAPVSRAARQHQVSGQ